MTKHGRLVLSGDQFTRRDLLIRGAQLGAASLIAANAISPLSARAADSVNLRFWYHWSVSDAPLKYLQKLADDTWAPKHSGSSLKVIQIPEKEHESKYTAAFAAKQGPDLFTEMVDVYTRQGLAAQLPDDLAKTYDAGLIDAVKLNYTIDGVYHAVPFIPVGTLGLLLFYNVDDFKEAGLDPEKPPTTMSELQEYAQKLTKKDGDGTITRSGFAHQLNGDRANAGKFYPFLHAYGGRLYDPKSMKADGFVNNAGGVAALQLLKDMTVGENKVSSLTLGLPEEQMARGQASMIFRESSFIGFFQDRAPQLNLRISHTPPEKEEGCGTTGLNWSLMVNDQSKGKDAAFDFLRDMATPEVDLAIAKAAGTIPAWKQSWKDDYMLGRPDYQALQYTAEHDPGINYLSPNTREAALAYAKILVSVARGEKEPQAAADEAASEIDRILKG